MYIVGYILVVSRDIMPHDSCGSAGDTRMRVKMTCIRKNTARTHGPGKISPGRTGRLRRPWTWHLAKSCVQVQYGAWTQKGIVSKRRTALGHSICTSALSKVRVPKILTRTRKILTRTHGRTPLRVSGSSTCGSRA